MLYLVARKPITTIFNKYFHQAGKNTEHIDSKLLDETKQKKGDYVSEANKEIQKLKYRLEQGENMIQQRVRDENSKALESIVRRAKVQIGKERDNAIREVRQEYDNLVVNTADNNVSHKRE